MPDSHHISVGACYLAFLAFESAFLGKGPFMPGFVLGVLVAVSLGAYTVLPSALGYPPASYLRARRRLWGVIAVALGVTAAVRQITGTNAAEWFVAARQVCFLAATCVLVTEIRGFRMLSQKLKHWSSGKYGKAMLYIGSSGLALVLVGSLYGYLLVDFNVVALGQPSRLSSRLPLPGWWNCCGLAVWTLVGTLSWYHEEEW